MAAAESLVFGGARGPAKAPKESKALQELKELKDATVLEEPKDATVLKDFDRGVQLLRLGREGVRGPLDRGVQADSTDLLREKALAQPGPSARMCSPGSECCFHGSVAQPAAHSAILSCVVSSAQTKITVQQMRWYGIQLVALR